jgi:hypothetical protein
LLLSNGHFTHAGHKALTLVTWITAHLMSVTLN